jgi:phage terminase small subunit
MLTPKQARFVEEYLIDLNATQAAIRAGYSKRTANKQGAQLLVNVNVAKVIDAAKTARSEKIGADSEHVLQRLVCEAEADLADLFDPKTNDLLPVERWPPIWRVGLVQGVEIEALYEGTGKNRVLIGYIKKVKLDSRIRRLELIGKHVQVNAFQETVNYKEMDGLGDRLERAFQRLAQD